MQNTDTCLLVLQSSSAYIALSHSTVTQKFENQIEFTGHTLNTVHWQNFMLDKLFKEGVYKVMFYVIKKL